MIGIGCDCHSSVFDGVEVILGPGNHLRSCGSTRAFICANNASKHAIGDDLWTCYCFEGPGHCCGAWEPFEELRLDGSFNLINKSRHFVVLVTICDRFAVMYDPRWTMIPPLRS